MRRPEYRRTYAAYCSFQREQCGVVASLFTSYEAVFLYQLAIDLRAVAAVDAAAPTCCRLRKRHHRRVGVDRELAEFCVATAMLLASAKLEDDVRDDRSWAARILLGAIRSSVAKSRLVLDRVRPSAANTLQQLVMRHVECEQRGAFRDLPHFAEATADAFELLFDLFGQLCSRRLGYAVELGSLGQAIGNGLIAADCVNDVKRDRLRSAYNPIGNDQQYEQVRDEALQSLSRAGWACEAIVKQSGSGACDRLPLTPPLLADVFHRFALRSTPAAANESLQRAAPSVVEPSRRRLSPLRGVRARQKHAYPWGLSSLVRHGDCDCACDGCGACEAPDAGCGGCGGEGSVCADGSCCDGADCCVACGDGCGWHRRKSREEQHAAPRVFGDCSRGVVDTFRNHHAVGSNGVARGNLNPTGVVRLGMRDWPAQVVGASIAPGTSIQVIGATEFGLIVRPG